MVLLASMMNTSTMKSIIFLTTIMGDRRGMFVDIRLCASNLVLTAEAAARTYGCAVEGRRLGRFDGKV